MEHSAFRPLLLRCAVSAMACDGDLHEREVEEISRMAEDLPYFEGTDVDKEVPALVDDIRSAVRAYDDLFEDISRAPLRNHQRFHVLEVLFNVVRADGVLSPPEVTFLQQAKEAVGLSDSEFIVRFPKQIGILSQSGSESYIPLAPSGM